MYILKALAIDAEAHVVFMADVGGSTLSFEYKNHRVAYLQMGSWLVELHISTIVESGENWHNTFWEEVAQIQTMLLSKTLTEKYGLEPDMVNKITQINNVDYFNGSNCVVQGDFRPGNVLVMTPGASTSDVAMMTGDTVVLFLG